MVYSARAFPTLQCDQRTVAPLYLGHDKVAAIRAADNAVEWRGMAVADVFLIAESLDGYALIYQRCAARH